MNSYLDIAIHVLRASRRPMTARSILIEAYISGIAPEHIFGKTQHKTLQARLSEDILKHRERSLFFRTKPGWFFLREFITDTSIPQEFRQPIIARRRTRDIFKGNALSVKKDMISNILSYDEFGTIEIIQHIINEDLYNYTDPKKVSDNVLILTVSSLVKNGKILSYRSGKYRDDRDLFANKRSIVFSSPIPESSYNLFDKQDLGITDTGFISISIDLDVPPKNSTFDTYFENHFQFIAWQADNNQDNILIAFIEIKAPEWFEPSPSKLSLNDIKWLDLTTPPNNLNDFDPYSQKVLSFYFLNR